VPAKIRDDGRDGRRIATRVQPGDHHGDGTTGSLGGE
jgi:hypothetical protein